MGVKLVSASAGSVEIVPPTTASNFTATMPAATGTVAVSGNTPAFSAYASATQSITTGTLTKVAIDTEIFDTNSYFDTTNNRFLPLVAGYYQVNATIRSNATTVTITQVGGQIYKNGAQFVVLWLDNVAATTYTNTIIKSGSTLLYLNGTTDYIELWGFVVGTSPQFTFGTVPSTSYFSASLVRGA
jgi:hypothetical protein